MCGKLEWHQNMSTERTTDYVVDVSEARMSMLLLCAAAGRVASAVATDNCGGGELQKAVTSIIQHAIDLAVLLGFDLRGACMMKMRLNEEKYPQKLCEGTVSKVMRTLVSR